MNKIKGRLIRLFFGRKSLDGYYKPVNAKAKNKKYIYSSIFPDNDYAGSLYRIEMNTYENSDSKKTHNA